jgi:hypothetical protein
MNHLARTYCQDRVKQARSYLKSIFDEVIEQEFLVKDPTRTLKIPKSLRPKDKQILTWEQSRAVLDAASQRDRILLMLAMTDALRPSELFAFRWKSFDDVNTVDLRNDLPKENSPLRQDSREHDEGSSTRWTCRRAQAVEVGVQGSFLWEQPVQEPGPQEILTRRSHVPERGRRVHGSGQLQVQSSKAPSGGVGTS